MEDTQLFEKYEQGIIDIKEEATYDKGISLLLAASQSYYGLATYALAKEYGNRNSKLFNLAKSREFYKQAFDELQKVDNESEIYLLSQHLLASYYLYGYGDIIVDESRYLQIEDECANKKYAPSCESLIDYYLKPDNLNVKRVNYYKELIGAKKSFTQFSNIKEPAKEKKEDKIEKDEFVTTSSWNDIVSSTINLNNYNSDINLEIDEDETIKSALAEAISIFESNEHNRYPRAFDLMKIAEEKFPLEVNCFLGELYEDGKFIQKDLDKAIEYYYKALENNSVYAAYRLSIIYLYESEEKKDIEQGLRLLKQSAQYGYGPALRELGDIYNYGKLGVINKNVANSYYSLADERGN